MITNNYIPINITENEINIILNGMDLLLMNKKELNLSEFSIDCYQHIHVIFEEFYLNLKLIK